MEQNVATPRLELGTSRCGVDARIATIDEGIVVPQKAINNSNKKNFYMKMSSQ